MDADRFDSIARRLGARATRRGAFGGLIGMSLIGVAAGKNHPGKKRKKRRAKADRPLGAPDCANPGPSTNLNGCDFAGRDFAGRNLSGSTINDASFRNADLFDADLSDNGMKRTSFRGANLCSANLSSSSLNNADFRGSDGPDGRPTNLTRANLRSSSCAGVKFDANTIFCATTLCNGKVRNDGCPAGIDPDDICCTDADCGPARICRNGECVPDPGTCAAGQSLCRDGTAPCGENSRCQCVTTASGATFCGTGFETCSTCSSDEECAALTGPGSVCADYTGPFCSCRETHRRACVAPCGQQCANNAQCGPGRVCCDGTCQSECCSTADCGPNETCVDGICVCEGCRSRINNTCKPGNAWAECGASARCTACHENQICAAGSQTCADCQSALIPRTVSWCEVVHNFATFQCGPECGCATRHTGGIGVCFDVGVPGYCSRSDVICARNEDCVDQGLGDFCVLAGNCEEAAHCQLTVCVTRCGGPPPDVNTGGGEGPLQIVAID